MTTYRPTFKSWRKAENYYRVSISLIDRDLASGRLSSEQVARLRRKRSQYVQSLRYVMSRGGAS